MKRTPEQKASDAAELRHFEESQDTATTAVDFINWLRDRYDIRLDFDHCTEENPAPLDVRRLADEWLKIDRAAVERARRDLLSKMRAYHTEEVKR